MLKRHLADFLLILEGVWREGNAAKLCMLWMDEM